MRVFVALYVGHGPGVAGAVVGAVVGSVALGALVARPVVDGTDVGAAEGAAAFVPDEHPTSPVAVSASAVVQAKARHMVADGSCRGSTIGIATMPSG